MPVRRNLLVLGSIVLVTIAGTYVAEAPDAVNAKVYVSTDLETWESPSTTVDDVNTRFEVSGNSIHLFTVTDDVLSLLSPTPTCTVSVIFDNGQIQEELFCNTNAQRVWYRVEASVVTPGAGTTAVVTPLALAGYGEVFLQNPNGYVTFEHKIMRTDTLHVFLQNQASPDLTVPRVYRSSGDPITVPCDIPLRLSMKVSTPDGFSTEHVKQLTTCQL